MIQSGPASHSRPAGPVMAPAPIIMSMIAQAGRDYNRVSWAFVSRPFHPDGRAGTRTLLVAEPAVLQITVRLHGLSRFYATTWTKPSEMAHCVQATQNMLPSWVSQTAS